MRGQWKQGWSLISVSNLKIGDRFNRYSEELNACVVPELIWMGEGKAHNGDREIIFGLFDDPNQLIGVDLTRQNWIEGCAVCDRYSS